MASEKRLNDDWAKTYPKVPVDNIKLDNPYVGKEPFKITYGRNEPPTMNNLMTGEYSRIWNEQHDQYLKNRQNRTSSPVHFIKPNLNARKPIHNSTQKEMCEPKMIRSKKYENIRSKIDNRK